MHQSAVYDPRRHLTPSQLAAAKAKAARQAKFASRSRTPVAVPRATTYGTPRAIPIEAKPEPEPVYRMWFEGLIALAEKAMKRPSIRDIQAAAARHFDISIPELMRGGREKHLVRARHVAIFITTRVCAQHSLPDIGRRFGGFDHTSILHARDRIAGLIENDASIRADIDAILSDWPGVSI